AGCDVRFVPKADVSRCNKQVLFDHISSKGDELVGYRETEGLGGREINDQIEFSWLLDWNLSGLRPAQYLIDQVGGAPPHSRPVRSIRHQTAMPKLNPKVLLDGA